MLQASSKIGLAHRTGLLARRLLSSNNTKEEIQYGEENKRSFFRPLVVPPKIQGPEVLHNPLFNKGTAFKHEERDRLGFRGLLPPRRIRMQKQMDRVMNSIRSEPSPIKKNLIFEDVHDRNETLYHRILADHIEELAPIVYTPTVGQVCREFGDRFRRTRGMFFSPDDSGQMSAMMHNWPHRDVRIIVVTDGGRILGLGDLGCNGMGIPIGKLSLYCAAGGLAPHRVMPVMLDVGTDNKDLLEDEFYLGTQIERLKGEAYFDMVDEFMQAVFNRWPNAMVQFEDFSSNVAQTVLDKYRHKYLCFNDDIQGTGATTLAGILSALRVRNMQSGVHGEGNLKNERFVICGAGSAGTGVAKVLLQAMLYENPDMAWEDAASRFYMVDQFGLLNKDRPGLTTEQHIFARPASEANDKMPLQEVAEKFKPTTLLGLTAKAGIFNKKLVCTVAAGCNNPVIFPLSNPTSSAECTAEEAMEWTAGKCIFASGSPFDAVPGYGPSGVDPSSTRLVSQCNNMFIFPGLGLGVTEVGAKTVTDKMLYVSAKALANCLKEEDMHQGLVFPKVKDIRQVSLEVATAVVEHALNEGLARTLTWSSMGNEERCKDKLRDFINSKMYDPVYVPLVYRNP